jgi:hypothetical protein
LRTNLANADELIELADLSPAQVAAIVRYRSEHGPINSAQFAMILNGYPLTDRQRAG